MSQHLISPELASNSRRVSVEVASSPRTHVTHARAHTHTHTHTQTRTHAHIHTNAWTHAGVSAMIVHKDLCIYVFVYTYVCEDGGRAVRQTCVCVYLLLLPGCHLNRVVTCVANSHIRFRLAEIGWCGCHFVQLVCWSLTLCWHRLAVKKRTKNKKTNQ